MFADVMVEFRMPECDKSVNCINSSKQNLGTVINMASMVVIHFQTFRESAHLHSLYERYAWTFFRPWLSETLRIIS